MFWMMYMNLDSTYERNINVFKSDPAIPGVNTVIVSVRYTNICALNNANNCRPVKSPISGGMFKLLGLVLSHGK